MFFNVFATAQTKSDELPRQGFLGAQVAPVPDEQRARLKLPAEQGIVIMRVDAGSSAEVAGLKPSDIVLKVGDANVNSAPTFVNLIRPFRAGQKVALTVMGDGKQQVIAVTLKPRPLETSPDFDIIYRSVNTGNGRLRVIVTKPKTGGKLPAVLLVGGIGCYSLDNFSPSHAYRKILYGLTNQGFATMRVEKSGMGDSEGAPCQTVDLKQEIEGYVAGLRALKTYDFVDPDKVFILGHSIGGIVGPAVAAEEKVRGVIAVATVGTNWYEYAPENYRRQALLRGEFYDEVETGARLNQVCKRRLWIDRAGREQIIKENPACENLLQDPASAAYMQQLTDLNLAALWKKVDAPTLLIYGASDFLTSAKEHEYLREMIDRFHAGRARYVEIPQMDHYFERAATQSESYQRRRTPAPAPPPFVEQALTEISNWLKQSLSDSQIAAATSAPAAKFTAAQFQALRWLEGDWRGTENGQNPFYERYSFVVENRIEMQSFKDAATTEAGSEKSVTYFKDGAIYHQAGRGVWIAERITDSEISFIPKENVRHSFVWKKESPDVWTAEVYFTAGDGQTKRNVYRLERIKSNNRANILEKSINDLTAEMNAGRLTSEQIVKSYLERIEIIDRAGAQLKSVLAVNPDALSEARRLDAERRAGKIRGRLHGVPILIKDNIETADRLPTTAGSLALRENFAGRDASLVARLRAAGAIILGKTNLSEWSNMRSGNAVSGWSALGGTTRNPYVLDRTASGSSTGSGVAVSANLAAAAIGTDTNGSITNPAAVSGIVALRPTLGLVSRNLVIPIGSSQDAPGPMTRTVTDAALLLSVIGGTDPKDAATREADARREDYTKNLRKDSLKNRRFGVMRFGMANYQPEVLKSFEAALKELRAAGARIVEITDFKIPEELAGAAGNTIINEFKSELNAYLATTPATVKTRSLADLIAFNKAHAEEELSLFGQEYLEIAEAHTGVKDNPAYLESRISAKRLAGAEGIDRLLAQYKLDALIAPTTNPAGKINLRKSQTGAEASVSTLAAVAGYPHLTVPMGFVNNLPVGLSFIGTAWSDAKLLSFGYAFEQRTNARRQPNYIQTSQ